MESIIDSRYKHQFIIVDVKIRLGIKMVDQVIRNGLVADPVKGTIEPKNIGIQDGKIVVISEEELVGKKVWDAEGLIVAPGFIDIHSHVSGQDYAGLLSARQQPR